LRPPVAGDGERSEPPLLVESLIRSQPLHPTVKSLVQWSLTWYEASPVVQFVALELGEPVSVPVAYDP
jgi:hypothetical protein